MPPSTLCILSSVIAFSSASKWSEASGGLLGPGEGPPAVPAPFSPLWKEARLPLQGMEARERGGREKEGKRFERFRNTRQNIQYIMVNFIPSIHYELTGKWLDR